MVVEMYRCLLVIAAVISSWPVNAQVDREINCSLNVGDAQEKLTTMTDRFLDVSAPTMTFDKLDSKAVEQICSASQAALREAVAIKSAAVANKKCQSTELLKSADNLIELTRKTIDEQKCR
jgi:hypothetical protein